MFRNDRAHFSDGRDRYNVWEKYQLSYCINKARKKETDKKARRPSFVFEQNVN